MTDLSPETVERMVALVRAAAVNGVSHSAIATEARAIIATLPEPVDPDIAEVQAIFATAFDTEAGSSGQDGVCRSRKIAAGTDGFGDTTKYWECRVALACLKRGRALERGEAR